ncbi:MAG: asparagine--tRNA ligase [Thermoplasmata archaeon]|nr:asparagine--tRNA ligase [Thermoplasmata archaeon]
MAGVPIDVRSGAFDPIRRVFEADAVGKTVRIRGWVLRGRSSGGILFQVLRDRTGIVQVTSKRDVIGDAAFDAAEHVQSEGAIAIEGTVAEDKRAPGGREVRVAQIAIVHAGEAFPIFQEQTEEFRLDKRHLVIRSQSHVATFRVKAELLRGIRAFLEKEEVLEVTPPIITGNAAEGGAEAFEFDYFGKPGFLAQTAQLYLEAMLFPHERVYAVTPSFRAEKSRTTRHLTEYTHLEVELAWAGIEELMAFEERMIVDALGEVARRRPAELRQLGREPEELLALKAPFPRLRYADAVERLQSQGFPVKWGSDLGTAEERALTLSERTPIFVTHFPVELKAFYMLRSPDDPKTVEAADLLAPEGYGEMIGGSARETDLGHLVERLRETGADPATYEWYLDLRRHGSVPHAGFGLGIERLVRWVLRHEHIRETTPFPRTPSRHTP